MAYNTVAVELHDGLCRAKLNTVTSLCAAAWPCSPPHFSSDRAICSLAVASALEKVCMHSPGVLTGSHLGARLHRYGMGSAHEIYMRAKHTAPAL